MGRVCPSCAGEYERVAHHWSRTECEPPELSSYQEDVLTGILMGDACIGTENKNTRIQCEMISKKYLEYLDSQFPLLGNGVVLTDTAEESAEKNKDSGYFKTVNKENYNDLYRWRTSSCPVFNKYEDWYSSGKKVFPDDIQLTPTLLKHWYVCDGNLKHARNEKFSVRISSVNEMENEEKIKSYFEDVGLPTPNLIGCNFRWSQKDSIDVLDYMGDPLPDFEYKWSEQYR